MSPRAGRVGRADMAGRVGRDPPVPPGLRHTPTAAQVDQAAQAVPVVMVAPEARVMGAVCSWPTVRSWPPAMSFSVPTLLWAVPAGGVVQREAVASAAPAASA